MTKVKKALKWVLALFCLLQSSIMLCLAQSETENLRKYWNYRDRFRKYFAWIGTGEGRSLPIGNSNPNGVGASYWNYYYGVTGGRGIRWGDCTALTGEYIGVLATEYKLLKDDGNIAETKITLNELYYAIQALNRLDDVAELYMSQDPFYGIQSNGFLLRDDVGATSDPSTAGGAAPTAFINHWQNEFAKTEDPRDDVKMLDSDAWGIESFDASNPGGFVPFNPTNEMSQDQFTGIILGLALVKKYVDNDIVQPTANDPPLRLIDVTNDLVNRMEAFFIGPNSYDDEKCGEYGETHYTYRLKNPVSNERVATGDNSQWLAWGYAKTFEYFDGILSNEPIRHHFVPDVPGLGCDPFCLYYCDNRCTKLQGWDPLCSYNILIGSGVSIPGPMTGKGVFEAIPAIWTSPFNSPFFDKDYNQNSALTLATIGDAWTQSQIHDWASFAGMEIFDLINALINNKLYCATTDARCRTLLNSAPCQGPYHYDQSNHAQDWFEVSKWSHPAYNPTGAKGEFAGNDYMLFYNLYRLYYGYLGLPAYKNTACQCETAKRISNHRDGSLNLTPVAGSNNLTMQRKFENYLDFGIGLQEFLVENMQIQNGNTFTLQTELKLCNNSGAQTKVEVQSGGHLVLGESTGDNYKKGILRVSAGHKLVLKSGSTLTINDKSQVIIEPGAYIEIEPDVVIELAGTDAKLDIQGTLNPITLTATHSLTITKATASVGGTAIFPNGGLHLQTNSNLYITGCTLYVEVNCPFSMEHDVNIELSDATALLEVKSNLNNINLTTGQSINVHKAASATTGGTAKFKNGSITMNNGSNVTSDFCKVYFDNTDFHYHLGSVFYINAEEALIDIKHSNYEEITLQNTDIYRVERTTEAIGGTLNLTSTSTDNGGAPSKFTHNGGGQVYSKNCRIYLNNYDYYYHPNANINLDGDMASLRFGRYVYLQPTANLTFSGTGYLGFNLIQNWGTYKNVIGDNSNTITLIGSGKTDKIVEVTSSHWVNPMDAISLITIKNGRVEFGSNALISIGSDYEYRNLEVGRIGWQWPQGTVPYGYGSGFMVGGQNVATMEDIDFYGLDFPIRAYSFWTQGADFTASNITFNNCYNGLIAWGKGFHLYNLGGSYVDNIVIGNGMETPSNIENAQYYQAETRFPVYYNTAGTSSLTIRHSTLAGDISDVSSYQGPRNSIKYEGGGLLNIRCSEINSIGDMFAGAWDNSIGMKISQGGSLNISPITGGYNAGLNKLETIAGIFFDNANAAFLNEGSNNLSSISPYYPAIVGYPSYSLSGTINNGCANYITANNNIWDYGMVSDPSVNHNYDLKTPIACSPWRNIVLTDNSPRENFCETQPPSPVDDRWALDHCPECPVIESSFFDPAPLNEALKLAMNQTVFIAGEKGDDIVAADMFYDILSISMLYDEEKINWLSNLAYSYFKETVTNAIATKRITQLDGGQKQIEKLISIISLNIERARERDNDFTEFYGYFDLASVFRIINERNQAVEILTNLPQCLSIDEEQYIYLSKTKNQFTAEQMVLDGTLDIMEFDDFVNSNRVFMRYNNTQANIDTLLTDSVNTFAPIQNTQTVTDAMGYSYTVSTANDSTLNYKIVKTNAQNNIEWEQQFNGALNGIDSAKAIAIDANAFIYVTGKSWNGLNYDIVTLKFDSAGNSYWRAVYNDLGIGNDEPTGIEVDTAFKIKINAVSYNDSVTVYKQIHYSQCDTNCAPSYRTMYKPRSNTYYLDFKVQPNPATDYAVIKITSSNKNEQYQFKLIDITGRVLINEIISDNHSLNLGSYPKGIYECILFDKDKTTKKQRLVTQ